MKIDNNIIHQMIRTFVGYGAPLYDDGVGANKPDFPFFEKIAYQDTITDLQLEEAAQRFYKYRNTQLPVLLIDTGLVSKADEIEDFLELMVQRGQVAKEQKAKDDKLKFGIEEVRNEVRNNLTFRRDLHERRWLAVSVDKLVQAGFEYGEAELMVQSWIDSWQPPQHLTVYFSIVEDKWTNRWGKVFTTERIRLTYPYNDDLNNSLKSNLPFPEVKFDGVIKAWTIKKENSVIDKALACIEAVGMWADEASLQTVRGGVVDTEPITAPPVEVKATLQGNSSIILQWPYISDPVARSQVMNEVKSTQGRKYDPDTKTWSISITEAAPLIDRLKKYEGEDYNEWCDKLAVAIEAIPEVFTYMGQRAERVAISGAASLSSDDIVEELRQELENIFPEGRELYPFQYVGVQFAQLAGGRCLIGDDMGVGKTIQAIAHIGLNQDKLPALIVVPASVKFNWLKECKAWLPDMKVEVLQGRKGVIPDADIVVCNYDLMSYREESLCDYGFNIVIFDESHYLKNNKAQRTQSSLSVAKLSESVICLSGTAITNRPNEFFTTLNLLRPNEFPHFFDYGLRYCDGQQTRFGWDFTGASNTDELHSRTRDFCIRRLKSEVLTELPDKVRTIVDISPSKADITRYKKVHRSWMDEYESYDVLPAGFVLNMLTALRHECGLIKVDSAFEYIKDYNEITGKPIVVFAHHKDVLKGLYDKLHADKDKKWRVAPITGDTPPQKRQEYVEYFQDNKLDVILCSTVAAKEGITLTAADTVVFIEREWVPGWEEQAEDRVNRIGQESQSVHAVYLSVPDTIDEKFNMVVEQKREVVKAVLDGGDLEDRAGIANMLIQSMIESGDLPANFLDKMKKGEKK